MTDHLEMLLSQKAEKYNTKKFIETDPVQFPRKLFDMGASLQDVEISAVISSWLAYGSRSQFIPKIKEIHEIMEWNPYEYIIQEKYHQFMMNDNVLYRFFKWSDFWLLCSHLNEYYTFELGSLSVGCGFNQRYMRHKPFPFLNSLIDTFVGIKGFPKSTSSACKRLNMFLRWMVRDDDIVDIGLWNLDKKLLIIPLDTHVHQMALKLGITTRTQTNMKTAVEITEFFKRIFPDDPAKGDFALYGWGIDNQIQNSENENH